MRSSISAQSCASVPPAPAWIETTASPASYSPLKSASSWRRSSSLPERLQLRLDVAGELGLELEQLGGVVVLALEPLVALEALRQSRECSVETRSRVRWSSQKPGSPSSCSSSATRVATASGSKVITNPGELGSDLLELLVERDRGLGHSPAS